MGFATLVPRTCAVRRELEAWGQQHRPLPLWSEKPGRTKRDEPRRWWGQRVERFVDVAYADGQVVQEPLRFLVGHSSQLTQQQSTAYTTAQTQEAERVADHIRRVDAKHLACVANAEIAIAAYAGRRQGRRGRRPRLWRYPTLRYRVAAFTQRQTRARRGRPAKGEPPQEETRSRGRVDAEPLNPAAEEQGWTVLATTVGPAVCADAQLLQVSQAQNSPVEPGWRWIKHPAAITPVWLEKPERIAA
jgi:hypothetical protein